MSAGCWNSPLPDHLTTIATKINYSGSFSPMIISLSSIYVVPFTWDPLNSHLKLTEGNATAVFNQKKSAVLSVNAMRPDSGLFLWKCSIENGMYVICSSCYLIDD